MQEIAICLSDLPKHNPTLFTNLQKENNSFNIEES
jgi:hypothetical protein